MLLIYTALKHLHKSKTQPWTIKIRDLKTFDFIYYKKKDLKTFDFI